jgi:hypothetical protein
MVSGNGQTNWQKKTQRVISNWVERRMMRQGGRACILSAINSNVPIDQCLHNCVLLFLCSWPHDGRTVSIYTQFVDFAVFYVVTESQPGISGKRNVCAGLFDFHHMPLYSLKIPPSKAMATEQIIAIIQGSSLYQLHQCVN